MSNRAICFFECGETDKSMQGSHENKLVQTKTPTTQRRGGRKRTKRKTSSKEKKKSNKVNETNENRLQHPL
jgi:hypothetical protein